MIVFGGQQFPHNSNDSLIAYKYSCNVWFNLITKDTEIIGKPPPSSYAHAMTHGDADANSIYIVGGFDGGTKSYVTLINVPDDLCNLWSEKFVCRKYYGCSFCSTTTFGGDNMSYCFSNEKQSNLDRCVVFYNMSLTLKKMKNILFQLRSKRHRNSTFQRHSLRQRMVVGDTKVPKFPNLHRMSRGMAVSQRPSTFVQMVHQLSYWKMHSYGPGLRRSE